MNYCKFCMSEIEEGARQCPVCGRVLTGESAAHHLPPGTVLRWKYLIGEAIGEGGFGITYVGKDLDLDAKVAVKEYYPSGFAGRTTASHAVISSSAGSELEIFEKGRTRFLQEARTLAKFRSEPSIVTVHDFFEENNTAYIVMEFVEGQTLKAYLDEHGKLTPEETLALLTPAIRALEKVHKAGLIHRDISPDNMMLSNGRVKLLDFGAARDAGGEKSLSVMLKHGYAPVEQYSRKGQQGPWTDVYALCATVYRCITGVTPDESIDRLSFDEIKKPSQLGVKVDQAFEDALMKGLAVKQDDRWQSVSELFAAFEQKSAPAAVPAAAAAAEAAAEAQPAPTAPDPDKTVFGGMEEKADPDKTVFGDAEEKPDPDKTVFGDAEEKPDPDKTVYGDAEEKVDPDKTVFGGAPQYRPDPDKTVYGGEAYDSNDARQPDKPEKKKSKKGLIIALIAAALVIAGVMIALFAMGVFSQKDETSETPDGHEHSFGEWTVVKEPTCAEEGKKERTCSCGKKETETIPKVGHNYVNDACKWCGTKYVSSVGLTYESNGSGYTVTGIGICTDKDLRIPTTYIGEKVTAIGENAFFQCKNLTSVIIPDSITEIGTAAFGDCDNLSSVTIGDGLITIGDIAFADCDSLTRITIPDSVIAIGGAVFGDCENLTDITVSAGNKKYHSTGNCIIETATKTLVTGCNNSIIPTDSSVTSIGDFAFTFCTGKTVITIPDNVTSIGESTFAYCTNLTDVTICKNVTKIGWRAFYECSGLKTVNYRGSSEQWENIFIESGNDLLQDATIVYNYTDD